MDRWAVEEMILGMARIVQENRFLRKENNDLRLEIARHNSFCDSLVTSKPDAKRRYDILCEIERQNRTADLCDACGWETNLDYIEDWEAELELRLKGQSL